MKIPIFTVLTLKLRVEEEAFNQQEIGQGAEPPRGQGKLREGFGAQGRRAGSAGLHFLGLRLRRVQVLNQTFGRPAPWGTSVR